MKATITEKRLINRPNQSSRMRCHKDQVDAMDLITVAETIHWRQ